MPTELDKQMADCVRRQAERQRASWAIDRRGWTQRQWCEDAERLMNEPDGAITSLVNGHIGALVASRKGLQSILADRERELLEDRGPCGNPHCRLHAHHSGPCNTV